MAHRQVIFGSAAREKIPRAPAQPADAIRMALKPKSKGSTVPDMAVR